ncbi:MAG: phosphoglucosamine mutase [Planctomycetes bacterium]|nr:phosphoglucosamine mutase [Planctomycetota bacterium]
MNGLMIGISGVRGVVGKSLTPDLLSRMGQAFSTYISSGPVVVGRDTRVSGEMVKHSVFSGLLSAGSSVIDLGIVSTPTLALAVEREGAAGGIMISASHNPAQWNALKFFRSDGIYLNEREMRLFLDIYYQGDFRRAEWNEILEVRAAEGATEKHIRRVLDLIDVDAVRKRHFKVTLDCCNGAGVEGSGMLLEALGCRLDRLHCDPNGRFPHDPEPTFNNLQDLISRTRESGSDIGFAQDPDADRLAIVDNNGRFIGEEYTLALAVDYVLGHREKKSPVVINLSTSRVNEDISAAQGVDLVRVPVGEVNVAEAMMELGSSIGGEGNGGVIYPPCHYGRDSFIAMALVLENLAVTGRSVAEAIGSLPQYHIGKEKIDCPRRLAHDVVHAMKGRLQEDVTFNEEDGLRAAWPDRWVHLRPSNTEPVLRIIAEAPTEEETGAIIEKISVLVREEVEKLS